MRERFHTYRTRVAAFVFCVCVSAVCDPCQFQCHLSICGRERDGLSFIFMYYPLGYAYSRVYKPKPI